MEIEIETNVPLPARDQHTQEIRNALLSLEKGQSFKFPAEILGTITAQRSKLQKETAPGSTVLNTTGKTDLFFMVRKENLPGDKKWHRIWRTN